MNTYARDRRSGTVAVLAVAVLLSACWLAPAAGADPKFVGALALAVEDAAARELELTAEQKEKLLKLIDSREDSQELVELVLTSKDLSAAEEEAKYASFRRQSEALGMALLSPQQRAQFARIQIRRSGLASLIRPDVAEDLILSEEQRGRIAAILQQRNERLNGARQDQIHVIRAETERQLAEVLTKQQQAAWEALTAGGESPGGAPRQAGSVVAGPPDPRNVFETESADPAAASAEDPAEEQPEETPQQPPEAVGPEVREAPAETPGKLRFNFKSHPWAEVLRWFAEKADLSYVPDFTPTGTFNYIDDKQYTPAEAIDQLNRALLTKGYTLVRSGRMLFLINLEDGGIPDALVTRISEEELDNRGESEVVSVRFKLDKLTPEEAQKEIEGLIGPQGKIVPLPKSQLIQVTETAARLRDIRSVLRRIEGDGVLSGDRLRTFTLKFVTPEEALTVMRPLFNIDEDEYGTDDGSIRLGLDTLGNRLLATGKPDKLTRVEEILKAIDVIEEIGPGVGEAAEELKLVIYPITTADPQSVLSVMQTLLAGEPEVRLTVDPKTGSLVALAMPSQHATLIKPTLEQYEGSSRLVEVIFLRTVDPTLALLSINKLFGGGGEDPNPNAPQVDADPISRQLLIRGTASQIAQIRTLLEKMGETDTTQGPMTAGLGGNVRWLPLNRRATMLALEQLQEFWPAVRGNRIRVVTPSAVIPGIRTRTPMGGVPEPNQPAPDATRPAPTPPAAKPPAVETPPASNKAAGLFGGARVFFAAQTVQGEPEAAEPAPRPERPATQADGPAPSPSDAATQPAGPAPPSVNPGQAAELPSIVVSITPGGVMIASQDRQALDEFEEWLTTLAGGTMNESAYPTIFYLKYAKAAPVAETLDQIFGGGTLAQESRGGSLIGDLASSALGGTAGGIIGAMLGGGGGTITPSGTVRITPEIRLNALIVQANQSDVDMIEQILRILDQPQSPEDVVANATTKIIQIHYTSAESVEQIVKDVFKPNLATAGGASGRSSGPSPEQIMQMLRGGRGSSGRGGGTRRPTEEVQKMTLSVDRTTNSLVVAAPEPLLTQVEQLVTKIDQRTLGLSDQVIRTVRIQVSPTMIKDGLSALMGESVQIGGSTSRTTTRSSSPSRTSSTSDADAARRRAAFFEMIRRGREGGGSSFGRGGPPSRGGTPSRGGPPSSGGTPSRGGPPSRGR